MGGYDIKRGHKADLKDAAVKCFENFNEECGKIIASFGALKKITAYVDDEKVFVEIEMKKTDDETSLKTIKAYNRFLEIATGYTAFHGKAFGFS